MVPSTFALWLASVSVMYEPASDAELTIWARADARSYLTCSSEDEAARLAAQRWKSRAQELPDAHQWAQRAQDCPHAPHVLRLAALHELSRSFPLPPRVDEADLEPVREVFEASRRRAAAWLETSTRERARRGLPPLPGARAALAIAHLGLGDAEAALAELEAAWSAGEATRYDVARVAALCHLVSGALGPALARADEARVHAPGRRALSASYIYALALDRAGEPSTAMALLRDVRARDRDSAELFSLLAWLPLHERVYLMALERQANASVPNQALRLWSAYLQLEGPSPAQRRLAERHRAELVSTPGEI